MTQLDGLVSEQSTSRTLRDAAIPGADAAVAGSWAAGTHVELVLDAITDHAILTLDASGRVTTWNLGAEKTKGYTAAEIIGRHFSCFYTLADQAAGAPAAALQLAAETGRHETQGWRVRKNGERFWAHVVIRPLKGDDHLSRGFVKVTRDIGQNLQIEQLRDALYQAQQQEMQLLAESTSDIVLRQHGAALVYVSASCQPLLGWTPQELMALGLRELIHPDDIASAAPGGIGLASGGSWWTGRLRRQDGSFAWVEASCDLRFCPDATAQRLVVVRDIDRQMVAKLQLQESEERYWLLAEHASDMIVRVGADLRYRYVSPACLDILGFTPPHMLNLNPLEDVHPDDVAAVEAAGRALLGGQVRVTITFRKRHRAGHWVWLESKSVLVRDAAGQPCEIIGVLRDVTANREFADREAAVATELRVTNALLRRAEAMAHIGNWRLDIRSRALAWSDEVFRIFGWPRSRVPTLDSVFACYHPDDGPRVRANVQAALQTGGSYSAEARIVRPGGEVRHVATYAEAEYDGAGRMVALFGTLQDVTERHRLEADLAQAQKLEVVGRVAAGIAHDFNNVLQAVMGGLALILDPATPTAEWPEYAAVALNSARRGAAITSGLLSYARRQVLQPRPMAVCPLLEEMRRVLSPGLPANVRLEIVCEPNCPPVEVDPQHLQTALENLAVNGVQAMPQGGTLRLRALQDRGGVLITVSDTGQGMDSATIAQAFEPFFSTKGLHGTGLGLSMVQGFARQSGGEVAIASVPGQGTCVEIRLPAAAAARATEPARLPPPQVERVLVVDDAADVLVVLGAFLRSAGFDVVKVNGGDAALALLAAGDRFAALVTDYAMPGMNGVDLIVQARDMQPGLAGLLISGYTELANATTLPGGVELLSKPFHREHVVAAVRRAIAAGHAEDPRSPAAAKRKLAEQR